MQILNNILTIVTIIANCFLTWFAITAWFELRRMKRDIIGMRHALAVTTTITMGEYVKSTFDQLNEMKATFHRLVENEQYEEAEELKNAIAKVELSAEHALKEFKDICGDKLCEVIVTRVKNHVDEEE
jgi:hypothetical protein